MLRASFIFKLAVSGCACVAASMAAVWPGTGTGATTNPVNDAGAYVRECLVSELSYWRGRASAGRPWRPVAIRVETEATASDPTTDVTVRLRAPDGTLLLEARFRVSAVFRDGISADEASRLAQCPTAVEPLDADAETISTFPTPGSARARVAVEGTITSIEAGTRAVGLFAKGPQSFAQSRILQFGRRWRTPLASGLYLGDWLTSQPASARVRLCRSTKIRSRGKGVTPAAFAKRLARGSGRGVTVEWVTRRDEDPNRTVGRCPQRITIAARS